MAAGSPISGMLQSHTETRNLILCYIAPKGEDMRRVKHAVLVMLYLTLVACDATPARFTNTQASAIAPISTTKVLPLPSTATPEPATTLMSTLTKAPTETPTPTVIPTLTVTTTHSPTPTPMGGWSGIITFSVNPIYLEPESALDGVWRVNSDGSELVQVLSRTELEEILGDTYDRVVYYLENNGRVFLNTLDSLHVVSEDWHVLRTIDTRDLKFIDFSPEGSKILFAGSGGQLHFLPIEEGGDPLIVSTGGDGIGSRIRFSADGTKVYYSRRNGQETWVINNDGTSPKLLDLASLSKYTPYEGKPTGMFSTIAPTRLEDAYAVSPDRSQIAFIWQDMLFIANADDSEIAEPTFIGRLPQLHNDEELARSLGWDSRSQSIHWTPDSSHVAVRVTECVDIESLGGCEETLDFVAVIRVSDGIVVSTIPIESREIVCGITPDGTQIITSKWTRVDTEEWGISLIELDGEPRSMMIDLSGVIVPAARSIGCDPVIWD